MTRILIVDDKEENLYYLRVLLEGHDFEVEIARHGAEALACARQRSPDLVVSDLLMPVMDGYTFLRHWRTDDQLARVPFIVYTATYTSPEDKQLAFDLGADAYLLKPAEPDVLVTHVRTVLASGRVRPSARSIEAGGETGLLREYSHTLVRKLEDKMLQLERANQQLQRDIAAREEAEQALRESEERFRQLAENVEDVFWLSSATSQVLCYVSPTYEVVWGRSRASLEADPLSWIDSVHPDDRARVIGTLDRYVLGTWDETYRIVRPDGAIRWLRSRAYPVRNRDGVVYRIAGVSRDITEYRRLEELFHQAQKMEAVGRLAGGVAHDFNNMLSVILTYATLVLDDLPPESSLRPEVAEIRRAGERAAALTRQLLTFSRQQVHQPRVIDLGGVIRDLEKMLRRLLSEDVVMVLEVPPESSYRVHLDPSHVEQIVMNLVINARDAMPRGGELRIAVDSVVIGESHPHRMSPGRYAQLTVADSGIGMDTATLERIFEPFFTTKEHGKGTGLGLSTVFGIVKQSQGDIDVTSTPGVGSTFRILLPLTERAIDQGTGPLAMTGTRRGNATILLVEDDEQVHEMCRVVLSRHGFRTLLARDGIEALAVAAAHDGEVDLLLTDVVMPRMGGSDLAERLLAARPGLKVLFMSGYAENASEIEMTGRLISKPITPAALLQKIREMLGDGSR